MSSAEKGSIQIIKDTIDTFVTKSGLTPNLTKCEVFVTGTSNAQKHVIANIIGMPLGSLPIKYLGLPLIHRKLGYYDCSPFLDKLRARISSWIASKLSYGGRLQLINSVLLVMVRY